jgi:squalene-hopene/tetraprenyl-beta-curcumene cyclase
LEINAGGSEPPNRRGRNPAALIECLFAAALFTAVRRVETSPGLLRNPDCVSSMNLQIDVERVLLAQKTVRAELLAERTPRGHWIGHVASSPLATAAAVSALVVSHQPDAEKVLREHSARHVSEPIVQGDLCEFLLESVHWLARQQNDDGGWGDCDGAPSNIAATLLVQAAFRLTGIPARYSELMDRADDYIAKLGGITTLRRDYGDDRAFVAAVLTNCALAGLVSWRQVPTLPFEYCCLPQRWQRHVHMPVARPATPLLLAAGLAKLHHDPPRNPVMRLLRRSLRAKALFHLERLQAADDSFLASVPITAFVVMSVGSSGGQDHPVVRRGIEFVLSSVRGDASWPVVNNLSTRLTSLALNSLAPSGKAAPLPVGAGERRSNGHAPNPDGSPWAETATTHDTVSDERAAAPAPFVDRTRAGEHADGDAAYDAKTIDCLLDNQHSQQSPLTGLPIGGWAESDAIGALPNAVDTARALVALGRAAPLESESRRAQIDRAAKRGIESLMRLQNQDGGWATFYRDHLNDDFDVSAADVTAVALRALQAWRLLPELVPQPLHSTERGWKYLTQQQRPDGSFQAKWFGNEHQPDYQNPVLATAEVLVMCAELDRLETDLAQKAVRWLLSAQHSTGGWGPPRAPVNYSTAENDGFRARRDNEAMAKFCTVEETACAVSALLLPAESSAACAKAVAQGLAWLTGAVEQDAHRQPAVLSFYPGRIWYHERLYPLVCSAEALSLAASRLASQRPAATTVG